MARYILALALALVACEPSTVPLPLSRDATLDPNDPVPSALLNKLQDGEIGRKHGLITIQVPALRWQAPLVGGALVALTKTITYTIWPPGIGGGSAFLLGFDLQIGTVIQEIRTTIKPGAGNTITLSWGKEVGGVGSVIAFAATTVPGADNAVALTGPFPAIASGTHYQLSTARTAGATDSDSVGVVEIDLYVP